MGCRKRIDNANVHEKEGGFVIDDKYESVTQTAERYGFTRRQVLEYCNARGQKFAFKSKGDTGKFRINRKAFHDFIERKRRGLL